MVQKNYYRTHWFYSGDKLQRRFYNIYYDIRHRTGNPKAKYYSLYGGKGVKCLRLKFEDFRDDMYTSYLEHIKKFWVKNTTIDRIDVNGNYCKENCRRATIDEQNFNKSNTNFVYIDGVKYNGKMLADKCNIAKSVACDRISKFLKGKISYNTLVLDWYHRKLPLIVTINNKDYTAKDVASITGINLRNARRRLTDFKNWIIDEVRLFAKKSR